MAGNLHTLIRDLQRRKARERRGLIVAEGRRLVGDALQSGVPIAGVLVSDDAGPAVASAVLEPAQQRGIAVETVAREEFDKLADTQTPSGVLAIVEWEPITPAELPERPNDIAPLLVLDGVQDPGNVGTMIRSAFSLGAWATVALDGTADVRSPKTARGAMGALFRHPVAAASFEHMGAMLVAAEASADAARAYRDAGASRRATAAAQRAARLLDHCEGATTPAVPLPLSITTFILLASWIFFWMKF